MGTQITPTGIKFDDYDDEQTKPICSVAGVEPDNDGNISLDLSSINTQISDLDAELLILEQTPNRTLTLSQSATSVNEGDSVIITLTTTNVFNGGRIPYTITPNGVDLSNDFTSTVATTGNFEIQNNAATLTLTLREDYVTESSSESFTLTLGAGDNSSVTVNVNDTTQDPTYSVVPQYSSVNEGTPLTITVATTGVSSGTTLYWSVSRPEDFSVDSGSFQVTGTKASSTGSFTVTPTADDTTESGVETFTVSISLTSGGSLVATTSIITINDTSQEPENLEFLVGANKSVVAEGEPFKIFVLPGPDFVSTSNVNYNFGADGTTVETGDLKFASNYGQQIDIDIPLSGTLFGLGSNGWFMPTPDGIEYLFVAKLDGVTEGVEHFKSTFGLDVGIFNVNVDIDDTLPAWSYALSATPNPVAEGQTVILTLNTANVPDGTVLSYIIHGSGGFLPHNETENFNPSSGGSVSNIRDFPPISNNITGAQFSIKNDTTAETGETMNIQVVYRSDVNKTNSMGEYLALSNSISIPVNDSATSQSITVFAQGPIMNPELRYDYAPEGYNIVFEIPCQDLAVGTNVSWQLSGSGGFDLNDIDAYYKSTSANDNVLTGNPGYTGTSEVVENTIQFPGFPDTVVKSCSQCRN